MKEKLGFLVCVWFLLCGRVARFVVEKNSLKVTAAPSSMKGVYECAIGNLGIPQYEGTLVGIVYHPKPNQMACNGAPCA
ncbi:hypothetical protein C1H46_000682 [Malus baccata]|uniref:Uncharacterized protein n=1 Tax=Malus baccata TaxID=106549 RepID=A0A540NRP2_MALBA|nr:hypothetical protein C1H46_000682 [Malus baccata]